MKKATTRISRGQLLADLRRVSGLSLNPSRRTYSRLGRFNIKTLVERFGSFGQARLAAGLTDAPRHPRHPNIAEPFALTDDECGELLIRARWPEGTVCPRCGRADCVREFQALRERLRTFFCNECRYLFTVLSGTVFQSNPRPMRHLAILCFHCGQYSLASIARLLGCRGDHLSRLHRTVSHSHLAVAWREELKKALEGK